MRIYLEKHFGRAPPIGAVLKASYVSPAHASQANAYGHGSVLAGSVTVTSKTFFQCLTVLKNLKEFYTKIFLRHVVNFTCQVDCQVDALSQVVFLRLPRSTRSSCPRWRPRWALGFRLATRELRLILRRAPEVGAQITCSIQV